MLKLKILNNEKPINLKCNISFPDIVKPTLQEKEIMPTKEVQEVVADDNFDGLSKVTVNKVTNEIDSNIKPENIRKDISILGVAGEIEELKATELTITPSLENQVVTPEEPNNSFSKVIVNKVTNNIDTNIKPENIKEGVSILGVTGSANILNGEELTITENGEYIPTKPINAFTKVIADIPSGGGDEVLEASFMSMIDTSLGANVTKLPSGITTIGKNAFYERTNLALTSLPDSVTNIGQYAFYNCTNLALTSLPKSLTNIDNSAFYGCTNLALTSLSESLTDIGNNAFRECTKLALTSLPSNIMRLGDYSFYGCVNVTITEIPQSIPLLGSYVFRNCTGLTELTFQGSISSIGSYTFYGCSNLAKLVFSNLIRVPTLSSNVFNNTPIANGTGYIYVPDSLVDSFKTASRWNTYADQIKGVSEL